MSHLPNAYGNTFKEVFQGVATFRWTVSLNSSIVQSLMPVPLPVCQSRPFIIRSRRDEKARRRERRGNGKITMNKTVEKEGAKKINTGGLPFMYVVVGQCVTVLDESSDGIL